MAFGFVSHDRAKRGAVGSLLDVPTHTVNMTTLCSTRDIWRSYSMNPYEVRAAWRITVSRQLTSKIQASSDLTLSDFLMENEGKRCVVVLDVRFISVSLKCG